VAAGLTVTYIDRLSKPEKERVQEAAIAGSSTPAPSEEPPSPAPEQARAPRERVISEYTFRLEWQLPDGIYSGTLNMRGARGWFRVRTPQGLIIDQDMEAVRGEQDVWLLASNPRYAPGTEGPEGYYYFADNFRLTEVPGQGWTIAQTCDNQKQEGRCSPVTVLDARAY
jgi:hypothetical protein